MPTGFGCYAYAHWVGGLENWRAHVRLMKAHGMNTFAIYTGSPEDIAAQIDIAIEEGMLESRVPMFILNYGDPQGVEQQVPSWDKVFEAAPPDWAARTAAAIAKAREIAKYPDQWPELIAYNEEEPGHGKPITDEKLRDIGKLTASYNAVGYRCGTACTHPNVKNLVTALDVIAVNNTIYGGDMRGCKPAILAANKEFWAYHTGIPKMNPTLARWTLGYWTWQVQPRSFLAWNWNGFIQGDMADPQPREVLLAYAQGVKDLKRLTETEHRLTKIPESKKSKDQRAFEDRLDKLRADFNWEPWENATAQGEGTVWQQTVPQLDLDELVRVAEQVTPGK